MDSGQIFKQKSSAFGGGGGEGSSAFGMKDKVDLPEIEDVMEDIGTSLQQTKEVDEVRIIREVRRGECGCWG